MSTIRILGAGAWGTALALLWSQEQGEARPAPVIELLARTADEAARHHAEALAVEIPQIDDVDRHGLKFITKTTSQSRHPGTVGGTQSFGRMIRLMRQLRIGPWPLKFICSSA